MPRRLDIALFVLSFLLEFGLKASACCMFQTVLALYPGQKHHKLLSPGGPGLKGLVS